jgi:hypothetical protein
MSSKTLWIGPLFGIVCGALAAVGCSGEAFKAGANDVDRGGSETTDTGHEAAHGGKTSTPQGGSSTTGGTSEQPEGGAPTEVLPSAGSQSGGTASTHGGSGNATGGSGNASGAAGSGGSGGVVVDPPDPGAAGDPNLPDPPIDPNCAHPIYENWSAPLSEGGPWRKAFGDPSVDTANHRLVLSYDDVAERTSGYEGSYYVESDVTIEGSTVFTPYPYVFEVLLPSLRRDAQGGGVELGATQYGPQTWSVSGWGAASGTIISGAKKVRVGAYVQLTAQKFGVKVSYGNKVYRSAWVTDFHWAKTNLSVMRYVGENNSGVYKGNGDLIYLDVATGCQALTDAAVETQFKN